jgi:hypothetical protein
MPAKTNKAKDESSPRDRELAENRKKALWNMIKKLGLADEQILGHRFRIGWNRKLTQFTPAEVAKVRASLQRIVDYEKLSSK